MTQITGKPSPPFKKAENTDLATAFRFWIYFASVYDF
jgi:hypothetical protein